MSSTNIKKRLKEMMPDKVRYIYRTARTIPKYLKVCIKSRNQSFPKIKFYSDEETVDKMIYEGKSLSRFGDGEFLWMLGIQHNSFQEYSKDLGENLIRIIHERNDKLMIGIPVGMFDSGKCKISAKMHWEIIKQKYFFRLLRYLDLNRTYCNASITRPYIDYKDRKYSQTCFENLKRIWENRDLVILEGEKTKMGVGNDLFQNVTSIRRIICPAQNAFEKLSEIEQSIEKNVPKNNLILAALGPAATILASDMSKKGYQVIDIGHIDVEYAWYLNHSTLRDPIDGKYVNESGTTKCSNLYDMNTEYINSIIGMIS